MVPRAPCRLWRSLAAHNGWNVLTDRFRRRIDAPRADRSAVAARAFATQEDRSWLEGLLWPLVGARVASWLLSVRTGPLSEGARPRAAVVEVPLLFEAGLESIYDATIAVVSDESVRRERAAARGHALADERAARQLSQEEKARRATFVVHNDGTEEDLQRELSDVLDKL